MTSDMLNATLGGVVLDAFGPVGWGLRAGVEPVERIFEVHQSVADQLLTVSINTPLTLRIEWPGGRQAQFQGLYVLGKTGSSRPDTVGIRVADLRWKWRRKLIKRSFNIRRRSGARRRLGPNSTPIEVAPVADDIDFQPWSLMPSSVGVAGGGIAGGVGTVFDPGTLPQAAGPGAAER
ncbi:MAG TPA: hypothetical protein VJU16_08620, partial [Planctomycetota bacterium]|nr:hypothetical protein [Planctomycetota bacterium]